MKNKIDEIGKGLISALEDVKAGRYVVLTKKSILKISCPCGYDGSDLNIGRSPISNKMICKKCKRYFNPLVQMEKKE